ncbi:MAG: serine hydrolase domain-containing protein [Hyphomonadaceae bacterium]
MDRRTFAACVAAFALAPEAFAQSSRYAAAARYSAERRGVSLLVMHEGRIVFEDYANEGRADRGWELASGTKSFTGVMAAAAVQDRMLAWDEPCAETLSEWRNDERRRITIRHLLSLTSGIGGGPIARPPVYADAIASPSVAAPGERFAYGPTPFQIFGEIMRRKLNGDPLAYLQRHIFDPLSIRPTHWRRGRDGNPHMPSGAGFTARDWAAFGQFVLEEGRGSLDRDALRACFVPTHANPGYGLSFWLLRPGLVPPAPGAGVVVDNEGFRRLGDVRMAAGAGNQRLYILPERNMVVVRQASGILQALMGRDRTRYADAEFLRLLLT